MDLFGGFADSDVEGAEPAVAKIRCHVKDDRIMVDEDVLAEMLGRGWSAVRRRWP